MIPHIPPHAIIIAADKERFDWPTDWNLGKKHKHIWGASQAMAPVGLPFPGRALPTLPQLLRHEIFGNGDMSHIHGRILPTKIRRG
jgi:hypothetical protein